MTEDQNVNASMADSYTESDEFPTLQAVLLNYFPGPGRDLAEARDHEFLTRYAEHGENTAEFKGLSDELTEAIRQPRKSAPVVNEALGTTLSPMEVRAALVDLSDRMTGHIAATDEKSARVEPHEALEYWFKRPVTLPVPWFRDHPLPIWSFAAAGASVFATGYGIAALPLPSWLTWIPILLMVAGFLILAPTAVAMVGLRAEVRRPEKTARRVARRAEAASRREERKEQRQGLMSILKP